MECRKEDYNNNQIREVIKENVYGIEKDKELYNTTIVYLNSFLKENSIEEIDWKNNLVNGDALIEYKRFENQFDFCVGNPPYLRVHNLSSDMRKLISSFTFSSGMFDLYITFYEIGLKLLKDNGKLGYITPNSFMKNSSQKTFRKYLVC